MKEKKKAQLRIKDHLGPSCVQQQKSRARSRTNHREEDVFKEKLFLGL